MGYKINMKYTEYIKHIGGDEFLIKWATKQSKEIEKATTEEVEHILDYLAQSGKKLERMSYEQAKTLSDKWLKSQIKKGNNIVESPDDTEIVLDFKDGFKVVKLIGENAYKREGFLMSHCVASYYGRDVEVYSLRDKDNMPHCTMEKDQQIKGKGNGDISPKYIDYVVKFLEHIDMTVGDDEMKHLGYVNIENIFDEISDDTKKLVYNKKYFPKSKRELIKDKKGNTINHIGLLSAFPLIERENESIKVMFDIPLLISTSIEWIKSRAKEIGGDCSNIAGGYRSNIVGGNGSNIAGGYRSNLAGGYDSNIAGGDNSNIVGNYGSNIVGNYGSNIVGGRYSSIAGGDNSNIAGGDNSNIAGGDNSNIVGNYGSNIVGNYGSNIVGGRYSSIAGGDNSNIAGGDNSNIVGGDNSNIAGGDNSNIAGGYRSNIAGGNDSNIVGGRYSNIVGNYGSNIVGGRYSNIVGNYGSNIAGGNDSLILGDDESKAKGGLGSLIVLVERNEDYKIIDYKAELVDGKKIKADTWYKLEKGKLVEVNK